MMCEPRGWGGGENVLKTKLGLLMRRVGGVRGEIIQTNLCYRMHEDGKQHKFSEKIISENHSKKTQGVVCTLN